MDLVKLEREIPIKSIPELELNTIILNDFTVWVSGLLSLTDEVSADRLTIALPAIKEHCWSMGFKEIKKMFEMYVDGKLSVKPLPNYFDRIMLGKIVESYKNQKPKKRILIPKELSEEQKQYNDAFMEDAIKRAKKEFQENGIIDEYFFGQYDFLENKKEFENLKKEKWQIFQEQKPIYLSELKMRVPLSTEEGKEIKLEIEYLEFDKNSISPDLEKICKAHLLKHYYNL